MMYMGIDEVIMILGNAIEHRKVLRVKYERERDGAVVERIKAPFDIGTTNPKYIKAHKNSAYMFCYDHVDEKTGLTLQIVHPVNMEKIISVAVTAQRFNENELADIHLKNTGYDYRTCCFAFLPTRNWFK